MAEKAAAVVEKVIPEAEELPKAIVRRVVKEKLSQLSEDGADISVFKEALMAFSESARIFIHYLSAMANDICKESKRQTINAEDVFKALEEMEFPEFVGPLKASLEDFRRKNAGKRSASKAKEASRKKQLKESAAENGGEEAQKDVQDEGDKNGNEDENDAPVLKSAGKRSASKAKETSRKKKLKDSAAENGGEEAQEEGDKNGNEDENDAPVLKSAGKKSASKAKEASRKKKLKESAAENGGEEAQEDVRGEGDKNGHEDEHDAPDNN